MRRSLTLTILASLAAIALATPAGAGAQAGEDAPSVVIALLPNGTDVAELGAVDGIAAGLMSAGMGRVPPPQSYLDITQGNRVSQSLYGGELSPLLRTRRGIQPERWAEVVERADEAPAEIVPGLLASTLAEAGLASRAPRNIGSAAVIAADRGGRIDPAGRCQRRRCSGLVVREAELDELPALISALRGSDLLIAIERPPPEQRVLSAGVAGSGFTGVLTSDTTRTEGLVTATDLAPTILERAGIAVPDEMNGRAIRGVEGDVDEVGELESRFAVTAQRRGPVVGQTLLAWCILAALATIALRARGARLALPLLALAAIYLPLVLLATGGFAPSLGVERIVALVGPPLLAALTLCFVPGWGGLGVACVATVGGYGLDVVAGSSLTTLSIPGPNPAAGSRFYGIGNEIEATLSVLVPLGAGAALAAVPRTRDGGGLAAAGFLAAGILAAAVFAPGRFGADVGAAIVLPAGAAAAAAVALGTRRGLLLIVAAPFVGLAGLALIDVIAGGGAHLTSSLLEAGGLEQAADVMERRVRLAGQSFTRASNVSFLVGVAAVVVVAVARRDTIRSWFTRRAALAGFAGAITATLVGTVSNDSGAILLILGAAYLAAVAGFAWAQALR